MSDHSRKDVLILGSVPLANSEQVISAIANVLGPRVSRIPDGETGDRLKWIDWQTAIFEQHPMFERAPENLGADADWRNKAGLAQWKNTGWLKIRDGCDPKALRFGPLGYAQAAIDSFRTFSELKRKGIVQEACRFQVSIPTPYNVIDQRIVPNERLAVERAYEARMLIEITEIAAAIPSNELAIQWDVAHEVENLDGARPLWFDDHEEGIIARLVRLGQVVPERAELGYHLCYGDFAHQHIIQPKDMGLMVRLTNSLSRATKRPIDWVHMPVPRDRTDEAYYLPLRDLRLQTGTRLYLGLIHLTDGKAGTVERLKVAQRFAKVFGVATECGFGRRDPKTIMELLYLHAEIADFTN
jgi:hypothetical protein